MALTRRFLRDETRNALVDAIIDGRLPPGARARERSLAGELEISRTPLREALIRLESEGFLVRDRGTRLFVRPLVADEARDLHALLGVCEALALRRGAAPKLGGLSELAKLLQPSLPPKRLVAIDRSWHRLLLESCDSDEIHRQIDLLRERLARYEARYITEHGEPPPAIIEQKRVLLGALHEGDPLTLAEKLERTWLRRSDAIVRWLRQCP